MKNISILGSTGSIGTMTIDVIRRYPDSFNIVALAAGQNVDLLSQQIVEFEPSFVSISSISLRDELYRKTKLKSTEYLVGEEGLKQAATADCVDFVVSALSGSSGLIPTKLAIEAGKDIGLANKESLVMGGSLLSTLIKSNQVKILPIDSEHSAIFQCLQGNRLKDVESIILTASGGPFISYSTKQMQSVTPEQALDHPVWDMGSKITIDSATLMNKGLEVIEARWLFDISPDNIEVLIHRQSVVHSMVRYHDGSIISQLGVPDMRIPILYALTYPERWESDIPSLDFSQNQQLTFETPDLERFPCLKYAFDVLKMADSAPIVLNKADEIAVEAFLNRQIHLTTIPEVIRRTLDSFDHIPVSCFEDIIEICDQADILAIDIVNNLGKKYK